MAKITGSRGIGWEHVLVALFAAVALKVAVDELSSIAEHGLDNWWRNRSGR